MPRPTADTLKSDIEFVLKIRDQCSIWQNTSFVSQNSYNLLGPVRELEETCERALKSLYQQYGEAVFPK